MKKYLVTGGAGFIGSNIVKRLLESKEFVRVVDNFSTGKKENIEEFIGDSNFELIEGDLSDLNVARESVKGVDFVLHQAAIPSVPRSINDPLKSTQANIIGTLNLLIAARDEGVKKFVYASSSSIYGDNPKLPEREDFPIKPISPYALTKYTGERYSQIFWKIYSLPTVCLRYFNVFGPKQDPESQYAAVIPKFITALLKGERPIVYGDGRQTRDFCVTGDALILMGDFSWKPIQDVRIDDTVISFEEYPTNKKRRFKVSKIKAINSYVSSDVYEIKTKKGSVKATGNHPWLMSRRGYRDTLKLKENLNKYKVQKLRKFSEPISVKENAFYKIGYIAGSIEGDGYAKSYTYKNKSTLYRAALSVTDKELRDTLHSYFKDIGLSPILHERKFKYPNSKLTYETQLNKRTDYYEIIKILKNKKWEDIDFCRGYLAGIFDCEGEFDRWQLRISNKNQAIIKNIRAILEKFNFRLSERKRKDGLIYFSILGGLNEHTRFFSTFRPKITRKRPDMNNREVKGNSSKITNISKISNQKVHNIEVEGAHTYIVNGFLCHNTYVDNVVEANLLAAKSKNDFGEVFNIACGKETSLNRLLQLLQKIIGKKVNPEYQDFRLGDVLRSIADISKARKVLGYYPKIELEKGLIKTVEWFKKNGKF